MEDVRGRNVFGIKREGERQDTEEDFQALLFAECYQNDEFKEGEMDRACIMGWETNCAVFFPCKRS
jgi:hypothetical protein